MSFTQLNRRERTGLALALILGLCAAGPKDMEVQVASPLGASADTLTAQTVKTQNFARLGGAYQDAPIPDEDVSAPVDATAPSPSVNPALISPKAPFQGDGYYHSSSQLGTLDARRQPAAGIGLSVPVN
jgi:hypothetical protein